MGVIYGTCGHDVTAYFERASAWWRCYDSEDGWCWSYGSLCDRCFEVYGAQRERPSEIPSELGLEEEANANKEI